MSPSWALAIQPVAEQFCMKTVRWLVIAAFAMGWAVPAHAQDKIPAPVESEMLTADGVGLKYTYFGGAKGKDSVPVILLHEQKGTRHDLEPLGKSLQELLGAAVIIPDLRGHGDSTQQTGSAKRIDGALFRKPSDFQPMVTHDLEAIKHFLLVENNNSRLNIDKLAVVGVQMGSTIGAIWGQKDWLSPIFLPGKTGQYVKALVLISPSSNYQGINLKEAVSQPPPPTTAAGSIPPYRTNVSVMVVSGAKDVAANKLAKTVYSTFELGRPKDELAPEDPDIVKAKLPEDNDAMLQTKMESIMSKIGSASMLKLYPETTLQGSKLLGEPSLKLDRWIALFINARCATKAYPWEIRKDELGEPIK